MDRHDSYNNQSTLLGLQELVAEIEKQVVGQTRVVRHSIAACLAGGHVLLEDVPGTGKTTLATSVARVFGLKFARIQGTPDLLPSELVGTMVFHPGTGEFQFRKGPVFTQFLLVDEINRATPRAQAALLEAMAEGHVSVDGTIRPLDNSFFVMATSNPIESQGVFPLPEAQLDRFLVRLHLGYTSEEDEIEMLHRIRLGTNVELRQKITANQLTELKQSTKQVKVTEDIASYIVRLCRATRTHNQIELGASPRSVLLLTAFAQGLAMLDGRNYVIPDDVQEAWRPVMAHRIKTLTRWNVPHSGTEEEPLKDILDTILVPTEFAGV